MTPSGFGGRRAEDERVRHVTRLRLGPWARALESMGACPWAPRSSQDGMFPFMSSGMRVGRLDAINGEMIRLDRETSDGFLRIEEIDSLEKFDLIDGNLVTHALEFFQRIYPKRRIYPAIKNYLGHHQSKEILTPHRLVPSGSVSSQVNMQKFLRTENRVSSTSKYSPFPVFSR